MILQLNESESKVVVKIITDLASSEGEDIIGILMKSGAFKLLPDDKLVTLAKKVKHIHENFNS